MKLRDYQLELVDAVWRELFTAPDVLAQLPTGGGKTACFSHLIKRTLELGAGIRVGVLMGRVDLVRQTELALHRVLDMRDVGVYCGTLNRREFSRPVTVGSIHSIADLEHVPTFNLLIVDEAHNLDQEDGKYIRFINRLRERNPKLKVVGFTATPFRNDGFIFGDGKLFPKLTYRKTIQDMIAMGHLCRPILRAVESEFDTSQLRIRGGEYVAEDVNLLVSDVEVMRQQIAEAILKLAGRRCVAWATANIDHCERVVEALDSIGETAARVHSKQEKSVRDSNLRDFMDGGYRHMVFVSVLSEGFDHPPIDSIVLMRPTRSPVLYVQTVGRGLRPHAGKENCLVLDYGQVVRELGPLDDPKVKGKKGEGEPVQKECPGCMTYIPAGCRTCPECGHEFPPPPPPEEKLTKRADHNAEILSGTLAPEVEEVGPAIVEMHQSKSGNTCVKITYSYGAFRNVWGGYDGIAEFFVTTSPWAMERLERRLETLDIELPKIPFAGEVRAKGTFEIVKRKDGKYDRVLSVKRLSLEDPGGTIAAEPTFDFGSNAPVEDPYNKEILFYIK